MAIKGFDINKMASAARANAARRRTARAGKDNRVEVGAGRDVSKDRGFQGVAGSEGSIAKRLADRRGELALGFEDRARQDAPAEGDVSGGQPLEMVRSENRARYQLGGRKVDVGDVIELYTNANTGWLRGRFEWSGAANDKPKMGINLWNPNGPFQEGKAPFIGDMFASIPEGGLCRWVATE